MKKLVIIMLLALVGGNQAIAQRRGAARGIRDNSDFVVDVATPTGGQVRGDIDRGSYATGIVIGAALEKGEGTIPVDPSTLNLNVVAEAMKQRLAGESMLMDDDEAAEYLIEIAPDPDERYAENKAAGERFLRENRLKPGVVETESGLQYMVIEEGDPEKGKPRPYDDIDISYVGKTVDGRVFDNEYENNTERTWPADLCDGLEEGLVMMSPGARYVFYIPYDLAFDVYGISEKGVEPYSTVIYEVYMPSFTEDNEYYSSSDSDYVSSTSDSGKTIQLKDRDAGDYNAVALADAGLDYEDMGYDALSNVYSTFEYRGFRLLITLDRIVVVDRNGAEIMNKWIDNKDSNYDYYSANVYEPKSGNGPVYMVIDMGYYEEDFWGSALYVIDGDSFTAAGILDVANRIEDNNMQINPVLYLHNRAGKLRFTFDSQSITFSPGNGKKNMGGLSGEDIWYVFDGDKLTVEGPATSLSYFRHMRMTEQVRRKFDDLVYHIDFGDINGDGEEDFVVFRYDNEKILVCLCKDGKWAETLSFDLDYDYTIDRDKAVVKNGEIWVYKNGRELKRLVLDPGDKLVEVE